MTDSMKMALGETERRRKLQTEYNKKHGITPQSIKKNIGEIIESVYEHDHYTVPTSLKKYEVKLGDNAKANKEVYIAALRKMMLQAAADLEFEEAARLRNEITKLEVEPGKKRRE